MRRYAHGQGCLMQFLQQALDDPDPHPCGRCSVCTGSCPRPAPRPDPRDDHRGPAVSSAAGRRRRTAQVVAQRPARPQGQDRRPAGRPGVGLRRRPGWSQVLASLWQHEAPAPSEVLDGMVEALRRWSRSWDRPTAVVPMPSRRYPQLVGSVAEHLARIGRPPLVPALEVTCPPAVGRGVLGGSGPELLARTALRPGVELDGPVLLVDDVIRTRWTVTVASALLVQAGAAAVLPLAVHQLP